MRTFTRHREREAEGLEGGREQTGRDQGGLGGDSGQAGGGAETGATMEGELQTEMEG